MIRVRVFNGTMLEHPPIIELPNENLWIHLVDEDGTNRYVGSLFFNTDHVDGLAVAWGTAENTSGWWDEENPIIVRPPKTEILIHAWHVWESSGGFEWAPTTSTADVEALTNAHEDAASIYGATSSTLATLKVAGYSATDWKIRQNITEFLEGGIQDALEVGRIGHIISRFNNEPLEEDA